ncbi:MAG: pyrroline-5-carboxylate reductase [Oscillospiraceae bacterium]|nr:pyrroline-5-carboxylate reductase [Oscillospiraceae bacterium]
MKYGFIGCGNMGGAIAVAIAKNTKDIMLTDRSGKAKALAAELGCVYTDAVTICRECERIFLAVKPQNMAEVLQPLQPTLAEKKPLLISMAAGLQIKRIEAMAGCSLPVIRIMPNTPVAVGSGITLYCHNPLVEDSHLKDFLQDASYCGQWDLLEESFIDAAGVVSGCGPAYMYMFLDALAKGAVKCGVPEDKAISYAAATMIGAAKMVQTTRKNPDDLKNAVCSPGGSTREGVNVLEEAGFAEIIGNCVAAAYRRNLELGMK